jgi:hypothetical protein
LQAFCAFYGRFGGVGAIDKQAVTRMDAGLFWFVILIYQQKYQQQEFCLPLLPF